jgi:hypothetical protein
MQVEDIWLWEPVNLARIPGIGIWHLHFSPIIEPNDVRDIDIDDFVWGEIPSLGIFGSGR